MIREVKPPAPKMWSMTPIGMRSGSSRRIPRCPNPTRDWFNSGLSTIYTPGVGVCSGTGTLGTSGFDDDGQPDVISLPSRSRICFVSTSPDTEKIIDAG